MTWRWVAPVPDGAGAPGGATVVPFTTPAGDPAGGLAVWDGRPERPPGGMRVDERAVGGGAPLTWVSLVALTAGIPFDDGAVTGALRRRLSAPWPGLCSTLLVDWGTFGGALTAGAAEADVADDPFAAVGSRRLLRVPLGALGSIPAPTGPGITRYGSGNPWPWDRYAGQVA